MKISILHFFILKPKRFLNRNQLRLGLSCLLKLNIFKSLNVKYTYAKLLQTFICVWLQNFKLFVTQGVMSNFYLSFFT